MKREHILHQAMLREHRMEKEARLDRRDKGKHKLYKLDSEDFGFKPWALPCMETPKFLIFSRPKPKDFRKKKKFHNKKK